MSRPRRPAGRGTGTRAPAAVDRTAFPASREEQDIGRRSPPRRRSRSISGPNRSQEGSRIRRPGRRTVRSCHRTAVLAGSPCASRDSAAKGPWGRSRRRRPAAARESRAPRGTRKPCRTTRRDSRRIRRKAQNRRALRRTARRPGTAARIERSRRRRRWARCQRRRRAGSRKRRSWRHRPSSPRQPRIPNRAWRSLRLARTNARPRHRSWRSARVARATDCGGIHAPRRQHGPFVPEIAIRITSARSILR